MELLVPIVLYSWLPIVLVVFRDMRGHRGLVFVYVTAWLFLPGDAIPFPNLPDYTKISATSVGVLLGVLFFDTRRLFTFRPHILDIFILAYCLCPIPSAVANNLGLWDGLSNMNKTILAWGMPYFFGRLYIDSFDKLKTLALGVFLGGLVYVPLCLIEVRMSPQIYNWVYGFRPSTLHSFRYGGWRPIVFLTTGLELGLWMTAASLMGFALWRSKSVLKYRGVPFGLLWLAVFATAIICKSTGALILLAVGLIALVAMQMVRFPLPALAILMIPLVYLPARIGGWNDGSEAVQLATAVFGPDRAQSLEFRFRNENMLVKRALEAPWFGWGGWGREKVQNEFGEDQSIVDGFWIVQFGKHGVFGLVSSFAGFLVIPTISCLRFCSRRWRFSEVGPLLATNVLLLLYMVDCLLNSMPNAIYPLCLGAVTTLTVMPYRKLLSEPREGGPVEEEPAATELPARLWPPPANDSHVQPVN